MTDRDQLHHLADRARRGVLLPAEGALLADAVAELEARIVTLEAVCESNKRAYKGAVQAAWTAEAAIERVRKLRTIAPDSAQGPTWTALELALSNALPEQPPTA